MDLEYIKEMSTEALVYIIVNILGFEETSAALLELVNRDPKKALELGNDILMNDKGDDYLQASVWDFIYDIDLSKVMGAVSGREAVLGKTLLHDIIHKSNISHYFRELKIVPQSFVKQITRSFEVLEIEQQNELRESYDGFMSKVAAD